MSHHLHYGIKTAIIKFFLDQYKQEQLDVPKKSVCFAIRWYFKNGKSLFQQFQRKVSINSHEMEETVNTIYCRIDIIRYNTLSQ